MKLEQRGTQLDSTTFPSNVAGVAKASPIPRRAPIGKHLAAAPWKRVAMLPL